MGSPSGEFTIGPPADYFGGHLAIGMITFLEAAVPIILYYAWQKTRLEKLGHNDWYVDSWKAMSYGSFITFFLAFLFWTISFAGKAKTSYLYIGMLFIFAGIYGFYITAQTIIFQFQAIKGYSAYDSTLKKCEIWAVTGTYMFVQTVAAWLGQHYLFDSIKYLLSAEI